MVAVSDAGLAPLRGVPVLVDEPPADCVRVVAIALSSAELFRPGSDLLRMIEGAGPVDLLLACEDGPVAGSSPDDDLDAGDLDRDDPDPGGVDDLLVAVDLLGLPDLRVHRLALRPPLGSAADADLVAALSELVGFDPDPGVQCLAPAALPGDPARSSVDRAVRQIAQVYGLPLVRYGCRDLPVVEGA
jgi:hypothetical protein